ncbi:unnamed protein product [Adineta steineri]|uniref:Uncharacterized protein n=1 Tax=Adineta steineri TaxID=433720 RepID=A0A815N5Z3_9BILA|nr:unnamed protein product [Adineta steineri]CAF3859206.1 unnamed protein product [Adineta steineri]
MDNEREDDDEMNITNVDRASSIDSLEQYDFVSTTTTTTTSDSLQLISGCHKWTHTNGNIRVEKAIDSYNQNNNHNQIEFIINHNDNDDEHDNNTIQQKISSTNINNNNNIQIVLKNDYQDEEEEEEEEEDNDEYELTHMDISLNHFDVQLQVNNGQLQEAIRYGVFSSVLANDYESEKISLFKINQHSQTMEMDMENGDSYNGRTNGYSHHSNNNTNNNDESYRRNNRSNDSPDSYENGNGANPNRNNNNSRRSDDDDDDDEDNSDDNNDDNDEKDNTDEDDTDDESDENIARRLGFIPLDNETVRIIGRLRNLSNKQTFDRRDFETLSSLIDELIRIQHLETFSKEQLKRIIHYLKLNRPLRTKSRALTFIQERIPRRAVKYNVISSNHEPNSNVFNIWRERERRARLDSSDSLEGEGQNTSGQQLRDVVEINHPTPPIVLSTNYITPNVTTKVKQMAKDIDIRSGITRSEINLRTGERFSDHAYMPRSSSPTYPGLVSVALYDVKSTNNNDGPINEHHIETRINNKRNINISKSASPTPSEQSHVRQMIVRLESSATSPNTNTSTKIEKKISSKKPLHDEHSDGSPGITISPPIKRIAKREFNEKNAINGINHNSTTHNKDGYVYQLTDTHDDVFVQNKSTSNGMKFEFDKEELTIGCKRTTSGATMDEFMTTLLPGTETSISMVRDVRACVYEDDTALSRTDVDSIPIKVDVETLYILEQKSDRRPLPLTADIHLSDYETIRSTPPTERQDFAVQTTIPFQTVKPPHKPVGTQVNSTVEQHTVAAQTTDSLHRPPRERQRILTPSSSSSLSSSSTEDDETRKTTTTTTTTRYEIKRRHSSHHSSIDDDDDDDGAAVIYIDDKSKKENYEDNFQLKRGRRQLTVDDHLPIVPEQRSQFGQVTSRIHINQLCDINRQVVRRHVQENEISEDEHRSKEVYEIHTRGACKCLVVSYEEKTQYGAETRFEKQLQRIERTYTNEDLKSTELHIIVTSSDGDYQLVRRDYGLNSQNDDEKENQNNHNKSKPPTISIHYYTKEGHRMRTEHARRLEHLPVIIRCEIEYELNHYGSAQLIILSVTGSERRHMCTSLKKEIVNEIVSRSGGRLSASSTELEEEITRQFSEPTHLLRLVDYSSRDDCNQTNATDLRRVTRIDVTTSLRLVQRYRTVVHRLCQLHRSHLMLTQQAEQQRHLILVANDDEYYLLDLSSHVASMSANILNIRQRQHDIFKREVNNVVHQPFDYAKYRRDAEQQQRILEQRHQQRQMEQKQQYQQKFKKGPPPPGDPSEAEFYLGAERRALIEREIHSMREAIRPHEHAPPRCKREPTRRSLSIGYTGAQRYVRARIIHVKDFYDDKQKQQQHHQRDAKEQELFVRVDDYINESAANSLRRSYSTDYLQEDGPRSRIRYIRIPGETIKIEEKTTYEYKGVMYANLPYSLRYWNILYILDREARQGRPLGSALPHIIVNDPYRTVIPPLTQQEIRQTAQQILSPQYNAKSYTDQTLRWFLSRDNRTEIESAKYLHTLHHHRTQLKQQKQQLRNQQSSTHIQGGGQTATANNYTVTETVVRYEKLPDRLVPVPINDLAKSKEHINHRSPSNPRTPHLTNSMATQTQRSQSQPRPSYGPNAFSQGPVFRTPPPPPSPLLHPQRAQLPLMNLPLSRHQSVHELYAATPFSHPPSPSPSLHSLHSNQNHPQLCNTRRPVAFNNRFTAPPPPQQQQQQLQQHPHPQQKQPQNPLFTEIIDSQTGRRILTTSQEQLPSEVLGLLDKYNLRKF